ALSSVAPSSPPAAPRAHASRPTAALRGGFQLVVGGAAFGNPDLDDEYADGGLHLETHYVSFLRKSWTWSAGIGFWDFRGNPQVIYQNSSEIDDPRNSTFEMVDLGVQGGQRYGSAAGFR